MVVYRLTGAREPSKGAGSILGKKRFQFHMTASITSTEAQEGHKPASGFWGLTLGSIGVVFGDIGTSPLYAFHEAVRGAAHGEAVTRAMVLGVLSLILWALFIVVTAK